MDVEIKWSPGGKTKKVRVNCVSDVPPKLFVQPQDIDVEEKSAGSAFSGSFKVKNAGGQILEGQVSTSSTSFHLLEPSSFTLGVREEITVFFLGKVPTLTSPGKFTNRIDVNSRLCSKST